MTARRDNADEFLRTIVGAPNLDDSTLRTLYRLCRRWTAPNRAFLTGMGFTLRAARQQNMAIAAWEDDGGAVA